MATTNLIPQDRELTPRRSMEHEMGRLTRDMDRLFSDFFGSSQLPRLFRFPEEWEREATVPSCNLEDRDTEYVLTAEVPGYERDELHIDVSDDSVTLKGEHREEKEAREARYVCKESFQGSFQRTFRLPTAVNVEGVEAKLKDGILTLVLPKQHAKEHRRIEVSES